MFNILISAFTNTIEQICLLFAPTLALAFAMNYVSGRLETHARSLLGSRRYMVLFGWLGTSVHELSHAAMCIVFRHRIEKIQLFNLDPHSARAGYVTHRYNPNSTYQKTGNLFIGVAPVFLGAFIIYLFAKALMPEILPQTHGILTASQDLPLVFLNALFSLLFEVFHLSNYVRWEFYVFLYILFCVGSSMKLSKADLRGAKNGLVALIVFIVTINLIINLIASFCGDLLAGYMSLITSQGFFIHNILITVTLMNVFLIALFMIFRK